jgi:hypothetical protein
MQCGHYTRSLKLRRNGQMVLETGRLVDLVLKNSSPWNNLKSLNPVSESTFVCVCIFVVLTDTDVCYA